MQYTKYTKKSKWIVLFLVFSLIYTFFSSLPIYSFGEDIPEEYFINDNITPATETQIFKEAKDPEQLQKELDSLTYEVESLRGENVKHFHLSDGTYQAVVYDDSIHRMNSNGEWEEIDNSLSEADDYMTTKCKRVKFAKRITGNESIYTLHEGNYKIALSLNGAIKKTTGLVTNHFAENENMTQLQKLQTVDRISSTVLYENILDGVDMEYVVISNNIKENIIVKELSNSYNYTFTLSLNGLYAKLLNNEIILLDSNTDEIIFTIPAPYMYDAVGANSYNVSYVLTDLYNGKYELAISADETWINNENRVFPIVIDPTLTDIAQQNDTYVNINAPTKNYGLEHKLYVSDREIAYYKFTTPNLPNGVNITSAYVKIPYFYNTTNNLAISVGVYQVTSSWTEYGVTWNSKPSTATSPLKTASIYANGAIESSPSYANFLVTDYVKSWYADTPTANYGFAFKREGGDNNSVVFIAREKLQVYGRLTIYYTDTNLPQGVYALRRSDSYSYFKAYRPASLGWLLQDTTSYSSAPVSSSNLENLFKFIYIPDYDSYCIVSMLDNAFFVYPSITNNAPIVGTVTATDITTFKKYMWKLEYSGGYYYISYTEGTTTYYIRSDSTDNNDNLVLTTNKNDTGTKWYFTQYTGKVIESVFMDDLADEIYVGDEIQYHAYMTSSRLNHLGFISYSVANSDTTVTSSNLATIDSQTGLLQAYIPGEIKIRVTYDGAPFIWVFRVTILTLPCSGYELPYNSSEWNVTNIQPYNNCYNYALNLVIDSSDYDVTTDMDTVEYCKLQIGDFCGKKIVEKTTLNSNTTTYEWKSYDEIVSIALQDLRFIGNDSISKNDICPDGTYKVALVLDLTDDPSISNVKTVGAQTIESPDYDFHWYRQNEDGTWSHKPGLGPVTNLDASGNLIYDPQICDRSYNNIDYSIFVGYYYVYPISE